MEFFFKKKHTLLVDCVMLVDFLYHSELFSLMFLVLSHCFLFSQESNIGNNG